MTHKSPSGLELGSCLKVIWRRRSDSANLAFAPRLPQGPPSQTRMSSPRGIRVTAGTALLFPSNREERGPVTEQPVQTTATSWSRVCDSRGGGHQPFPALRLAGVLPPEDTQAPHLISLFQTPEQATARETNATAKGTEREGGAEGAERGVLGSRAGLSSSSNRGREERSGSNSSRKRPGRGRHCDSAQLRSLKRSFCASTRMRNCVAFFKFEKYRKTSKKVKLSLKSATKRSHKSASRVSLCAWGAGWSGSEGPGSGVSSPSHPTCPGRVLAIQEPPGLQLPSGLLVTDI
ncbi:PREDICTED: uncharacterized protein LOC102005985 [Chinchilla lanigera]|uniref:uncharacterized protein LOC102005985 n=1 Tax=Chinchilla lanigera TaxID=34839 RepID=UPI00038EFCAB|nr:PREDICTED: uncharacterized protein LOC102005985 [Chinchilla lanigera]